MGQLPHLLVVVIVVLPMTLASYAAGAEEVRGEHGIVYQYGRAYIGEPELPPDFPHFRYVNPNAPKGGEIRLAELGTWDSFNATAATGRIAAGSDFWIPKSLLYDRLMEHALDEPTARYGRLAEGIAVAEDCTWIAFKLREGARWHDGVPITPTDFVFSFEHYKHTADPDIRAAFTAYKSIEVLSDTEIRYWVADHALCDPIIPMRVANVPVLPAHYWQAEGRDVTKMTVEPPLGSGPYRIADFQVGRFVKWKRVEDYWGQDLPVNRGRFNFDVVRYDYFNDQSVIFEATKAGLIDLREETTPRRFFKDYVFPAAQRGHFKTELVHEARPAGLWWPVFWNLRQPRFQDIRVREALWLLYDTRWMNEKTSHGYWGEGTSFFHDSLMAQRGLPSDDELELLEPLRGEIPDRVFTQEFVTPPDIGPGWTRAKLLRAMQLLNEAGWVVRDDVLVHQRTGEPFEIELVCVSRGMVAHLYPYTRVLARVGIRALAIAPETSNWLHRMRTGEFDGGTIAFLPDYTPTLLVSNSFSSAAAEQRYSFNWAHVKNPALDKLITALYQADTKRDFYAAARAVDRVLLWNFYYIPGMSKVSYALVYWDKFGRPPQHDLQTFTYVPRDNWWWAPDKARRRPDG